MALTSKNLNTGHLQGIMVGEVYSPRDGIALVTVKSRAICRSRKQRREKRILSKSPLTTTWRKSFGRMQS